MAATQEVPVVLVIAPANEALPALAAQAGRGRWKVETRPDARSGRASLSQPNVRLVVVDDGVVPENERGWLLEQIHSHAARAFVVYVAQQHSPETEKRARTHGVLHYTSKPIETERFVQVLRAFMEPDTLVC